MASIPTGRSFREKMYLGIDEENSSSPKAIVINGDGSEHVGSLEHHDSIEFSQPAPFRGLKLRISTDRFGNDELDPSDIRRAKQKNALQLSGSQDAEDDLEDMDDDQFKITPLPIPTSATAARSTSTIMRDKLGSTKSSNLSGQFGSDDEEVSRVHALLRTGSNASNDGFPSLAPLNINAANGSSAGNGATLLSSNLGLQVGVNGSVSSRKYKRSTASVTGRNGNGTVSAIASDGQDAKSFEIDENGIRVGKYRINADGVTTEVQMLQMLNMPEGNLAGGNGSSTMVSILHQGGSATAAGAAASAGAGSSAFSGILSPQSAISSNKPKASDFILLGSRIGRGNSGTVVKGLSLQDFKVYALKSITIYDRANRHQLEKELNAYTMLQNPYLVSFYGGYLDQGSIIFVLEYMNRGSLQDVIDSQKGGPIDETVIKRIAKMVLLGLKYMHLQRQVHRDIKPANILLNRAGVAKITDFGIVKDLGDQHEAQTFVGTRIYMSPERLKNEKYSYPSDIWSFGLTLHTLARGEFPYKGVQRGFIHLYQAVTQDPVPQLPKSKFSIEFRSFLTHCLEKEPETRWTAEQLLDHPFVADVDLEESFSWPWDTTGDRDIQDLHEIAEKLGKTIFAKNQYRRCKENSEKFAKIAESLCMPASDAQTVLERSLPLKCLAESPFK